MQLIDDSWLIFLLLLLKKYFTCSEYGYRVNLTTNGLLIREMAAALIGSSALRQIKFSLHSQKVVKV